MKYRPKHVAEYVVLLAFIGTLRLTPHRLAMAQGWLLAWVIHHGFKFRRDEVHRRIRQVFGTDMPEKEVKRIAWISFRNLAFNAIEVIRAPRLGAAWQERHLRCDETMDQIRAYTDRGKGVIVVLVHSGNWDLSGMMAERRNIPAAYIARTQKNPLTNAYLNKIRALKGSVTIDRDDRRFLPKVLENLKNGKALAILIDLRAKTPVPEVEFLGHPANLGAGMVMIAQHSGAPILPMALVREGWFNHHWEPMGELRTDPEKNKKAERIELLQTTLDGFTTFIREHPEQYFWYNKRWVLDPITPTEPTSNTPPS